MNEIPNDVLNRSVMVTLVTGERHSGTVIWQHAGAFKFVSTGFNYSTEHVFNMRHVVGFELLTDD